MVMSISHQKPADNPLRQTLTISGQSKALIWSGWYLKKMAVLVISHLRELILLPLDCFNDVQVGVLGPGLAGPATHRDLLDASQAARLTERRDGLVVVRDDERGFADGHDE
jgi:hypothetical protein